MSIAQRRQTSTLQSFWSDKSNTMLYRLKVEGVTKRIMFNREELQALAETIHQALEGAPNDRNHQ